MTTYTNTVYPWSGTGSVTGTYSSSVTTSTTVLDVQSVQSVIARLHADNYQLQQKLHALEGSHNELWEMVDWLSRNPGSTPADFMNLKAVKAEIQKSIDLETTAKV
jgi:hypothetical protein